MKRVLAAALMLMLLFAACAEGEKTASAYERVAMNATREEVCALLGEGEEKDAYILFGGEVLCAFYESGRLNAKMLYFENILDVAPLCACDTAKLTSLRQGMLLEEFVGFIGAEGLEIMAINLSDEENSGLRRVFAWQTGNGIAIQALFELDDNEWRLFAVVESAAQN